MSSIYQQYLGSDFYKLHPEIQKRFGFSSEDKTASIGNGMMEKVWYSNPLLLPFLYLGAWRHIMFPAKGKNVPFTIENYAYRDKFGRETVTWVRKFHFPRKTRRFDATMIYSHQRRRIVDYLGNRQHLAVDIDMEVAENGGVHIRSGEQRFYEKWLGFRFPMALSGIAEVREWFDEKLGMFKIDVRIRNPKLGDIFGYNGKFNVEYEYIPLPEMVPKDVKPLREEIRE